MTSALSGKSASLGKIAEQRNTVASGSRATGYGDSPLEHGWNNGTRSARAENQATRTADGSRESVAHGVAKSGDSGLPDCLDLHLQPEMWIYRDGKAYCPLCRVFKGYLRVQY